MRWEYSPSRRFLWVGNEIVRHSVAKLLSPRAVRWHHEETDGNFLSALTNHQILLPVNKGYEERYNPGVLLRPGLDPLSTNPRFQDLARRVGLNH